MDRYLFKGHIHRDHGGAHPKRKTKKQLPVLKIKKKTRKKNKKSQCQFTDFLDDPPTFVFNPCYETCSIFQYPCRASSSNFKKQQQRDSMKVFILLVLLLNLQLVWNDKYTRTALKFGEDLVAVTSSWDL